MVLGMIVVIFSLLFGIETVYAESLQQDTQTPTSSATPKGTSTPYPTNQSPTPGEGSGCPQDYPDNMSASYYRNCRMCFEGKDNPLQTSTPTPTGTLIATSTPTQTVTPSPTMTPTGLWYGLGKPINISRTVNYGSQANFGVVTNTDYCPGGQIAGIHVTSNRNHLWYSYDGSQFWEYTFATGSFWLGVLDSSARAISNSYYPGQSYDNHPANNLDSINLRISPYDQNLTATINLIVCKNYADPVATQTPSPTPQPTKICVTPDKVKVITKMDTFTRGLERVDDEFASYYRIYPYDVGSYKSLYERDFYNKEFEISLKTSGATYFDFVQTEEDVNVLYGKHKIDFYDCADRLIGTYTSTEGNDETKHWAFTQPVSLCRVHVETIDDGLEKQFSSKGVITDGCQQVNCESTDDSGRGYQFDEDSPIGIDIGGWAEYNQCRMLFDGFDMALIRNPIQGLLDYANIKVTLPEFPNIPWIQLCVQYWRMPVIKYFELEIPIGNILLFIAVMFTFGNPIGNGKGK